MDGSPSFSLVPSLEASPSSDYDPSDASQKQPHLVVFSGGTAFNSVAGVGTPFRSSSKRVWQRGL